MSVSENYMRVLTQTLLEAARLGATLEIQFRPEDPSEVSIAMLARDYLEGKGYENTSHRPDLFIMQPAALPQKGD